MTSENIAVINSKPRVRINNEIRNDLSIALMFMRINSPFSGMASAELRFLNWVGNAENSEADFAFQSIALGDRVEILAGDTDQSALFVGDITAIEETYGNGAPQLTLLMEDDLHLLAKQRRSRVFDSVSINDLLQSVLSDAGLNGDIQVSSDTGTWHQLNESNLAFLYRVLSPFDVAIRTDSNAIRIKSEEDDANPVSLHAQQQIKKMRIIADLNHQYTSSEIKGFNLDADEETSATESDSQAESGTDASQILSQLGWGGEELMAHPFSRNQSEATAWATAAFRKKSKQFVHGDLICTGDARLRTAKQIELTGASSRLNGKYRVMQSQHTFDQTDGYKTRLKITRSSWNNS